MSKTKAVLLTIMVIVLMAGAFLAARGIYHQPGLINQLSLENYTLEQANRLRGDTIRMQERLISEQAGKIADHHKEVAEVRKQIQVIKADHLALQDSVALLPPSGVVDMFVQITGEDQGGLRYGVSEGNIRTGVEMVLRGAHCKQELAMTQQIVERQDSIIIAMQGVNLHQGIIIAQQKEIIISQERIIYNQRIEGAIVARQNRRWRIVAGIATVAGIVAGYLL